MFDIGQKIKDLLHEKKISQAELARRLNVTSQSIGSSLRRSSMTTDLLIKIMGATGIKSVEVFEEEIKEAGRVESIAGSTTGVDKESEAKINQLSIDLALCKKDVHFYKSQAEEKERTIEILRGKE